MSGRASRSQVARALLDGARGASWASVSRAAYWGLLPKCVAAAQRGLGMPIARARRGERTLSFAIDFFDEPVVDADVAAEVDLYLKLQYLREGYERPNFAPGVYVQPRSEPHDRYCRLRKYGAGHSGDRVYGRFGATYGEGPRPHAVELLEGRP